MSGEYSNNHYVPQWYQNRFVPQSSRDRELWYLELNPSSFRDGRGDLHQRTGLHRWGFRKCFAEPDLYTTRFGGIESRELEKQFFGAIDDEGKKAIDYFSEFAQPSAHPSAFQWLIQYMSTQKLRTPKGLDWLASQVGADGRDVLLYEMARSRQLFCALWTECVWQIADATQSNTKFIVSDHPVTVYNRACGPRKQWCRGPNDPPIHFQGTHTIFPLSLDKVLILTNLSWARNPYLSPTSPRPNPRYLRDTFFNFMRIQTLRHLSEQEVREINFIIKSRAYRYVGAAEQEWLYPERRISKSDWNVFGDGWLLMPDPRSLAHGGEMLVGYGDGSSDAMDAYGRRTFEAAYGMDDEQPEGYDRLSRFQGEFARNFGPYRRGRACFAGRLEEERDSDEMHAYYLSLAGRRGRRRT